MKYQNPIHTTCLYSLWQKLAVVPSFRYLASILCDDNSIDNQVQNRIHQASVAFGRLAQLKAGLKRCNIKPGDLELCSEGIQALAEERIARRQQKRLRLQVHGCK